MGVRHHHVHTTEAHAQICSRRYKIIPVLGRIIVHVVVLLKVCLGLQHHHGATTRRRVVVRVQGKVHHVRGSIHAVCPSYCCQVSRLIVRRMMARLVLLVRMNGIAHLATVLFRMDVGNERVGSGEGHGLFLLGQGTDTTCSLVHHGQVLFCAQNLWCCG